MSCRSFLAEEVGIKDKAIALEPRPGELYYPDLSMTSAAASTLKSSFLRNHPAVTYALLTFAISWTGALLVAAPKRLEGAPLPKLTGVLMFPAMLLGPSFSGIFLTRWIDGRAGLEALFARMRRVRFPLRWYAVLLIPPGMVLGVLLSLKTFVSGDYTPNRFWIGITFGIAAGILEEIGWMGFAYVKLRQRLAMLPAASTLGLLWGLWHLPVIDFLGAASPHGRALPAFMVAFVVAMTAMRVLIAWAYEHTQSVALAQLFHISSTGALVIFSPASVSPTKEATWYGVYSVALWLLALLLTAIYRSASPRQNTEN